MAKIFLLICTSLFILSAHAAPKSKKASVVTSDKYCIAESLTPNFTTLADYPNFTLRRRWELPTGTINLRQYVTGAVDLEWTKGKTHVQISKYVTDAVYQEWTFGNDAKIIIDISVTGAVSQNWYIKDKSYYYQRTVTDRIYQRGLITAQDREQYQQEIDEWCAANERFVPSGFCIIYDVL